MKVVGLILGGGAGTRLHPLTRDRAKPAVPVGGKYRLVDIPISNCIHNDIKNIYLLTQFNSVSLHQHIQSTYQFDQFNRNFVQILAAQQTEDSVAWFEGTADAVRQTFPFFMDQVPEFIAILSGDQLYNMSFIEMIEQHIETRADVTISTKPVLRDDAFSLGILKVDGDKKITHFVEKPGDTPALDELRVPMYEDERYLASMGIYIFNTKVLMDLLEDETKTDFGKHIIPAAINTHRVYSYIYHGYWKDIGTIRSFWETNLSLTEPLPPFDIYNPKSPIFTRMRYLPPSKVNHCNLSQTLVTEGGVISAERIHHSIIGLRSVVGEGTVIEDSVVMGADYFDSQGPIGCKVGLGIGRDCEIRNAIIDKNVRIGDGVKISPDGKADETFTDQYAVREGIIVIPKNTVIPSGTVL